MVCTFNGTIVTKGDLTLRGVFNALQNYPAIVSNGNLTLSTGGTTINGIVFIGGANLNTGGTQSIHGAVIFVGTSPNMRHFVKPAGNPYRKASWGLVGGH